MTTRNAGPSVAGRAARALAALLLGGAIFATTAEVVVRRLRLEPRLQVIAHDRMKDWEFFVAGGVPLWRVLGSAERRSPPCAPGSPEVWLVGDSIFFGTNLEAVDALGASLQRAIAAAGRDACVRDLSQPAYGGLQRVAEAELELTSGRVPTVVVVEGWESDPGVYTPIDGAWYALYNIRRDEEGWPAPIVPVPTRLHHALFLHSRAWWFLTLALAREDAVADADANRTWREVQLPRLVGAIREAGARPLFVEVPRLHRPFEASAEVFRTQAPERRATAEAVESLGVPFIHIAERLSGRDVAPIALDDCCHLTPEGSRIYAEAILPDVIEALDAVAPPKGSSG